MTTGKLISQDEKLHKAISRILADVVINQSASNADIASGIYKPINRTASLINFEKLIIVQQEAVVTVQAKKPPFRQ
jgi:hypothetical protein